MKFLEKKEVVEEAKPDEPVKPESSHSGSGTVFKVEARSLLFPKQARNGQLFGTEWMTVQFDAGPVGVPDESYYAKFCGLPPPYKGHEAAMALAWWFMASHQWEFQVRVRAYHYVYSNSVTVTDQVIELNSQPAFTAQREVSK